MTKKRSVLIIGGGVAGMSAAKALDASGFAVHLLEKRDRLGGQAFDWACMATDVCQNCGACLAAEMADQVAGLARTTVHPGCELAAVNRTAMGYQAILKGKSSDSIDVDAILLATGLAPFNPTGFESLGYAEHEGVITTVELNSALKNDRLDQILAGRTSPSIAFIQCVGSRNRAIGRDYCSQVCCKTSIRQANKLLHLYPQAQVSIFHLDLQIIGKQFRTQWADLAGRVNFLQGLPAEVLTGYQKDKLTVIREDYESGARLAHHFDLIVLAVGIEPASGLVETAALLGVTPDEWGFFGDTGADLPKGIYLAGAAASPTDILSAAAQGEIAALQIARDLSEKSQPTGRPSIAVLGPGNEARTVAKAMAGKGYPIWLFDPGDGAKPSEAAVHYLSHCRLIGLDGTYGAYRLKVETPSDKESVQVEAIIVVDGITRSAAFSENDSQLAERIVDLSAFSDRYAVDPTGVGQRIVFWLDPAGPEWKDNCRKALAMASELAERQQAVSLIMDKMMVHGLSGQRLYDLARKKGVKFLRLLEGCRPKLEAVSGGLAIDIREATLPGVDLRIACDQLVIADKILPVPHSAELGQTLGLAQDCEGFIQDPNVRHRPVGSPRRGIFFAGSCHDENDADDLEREIQTICSSLEVLKAGVRKADEWPHIHEGRCVRCLTCLRICPHAAIIIKNFRQPEISTAACFDCGLCVANCPAKAIEPLHLALTASMGEVPPDTVVFACRRSAALAASQAQTQGLIEGAGLRVITVNCASRLNIETLLAPLIEGSRKVLVAACHEGNCRSTAGGRTAAAQVARVVEEINLPAATFSFHSIAANEPGRMARLLSGSRSAQ
jgi:heterodisulfide reductase subunit A